jgi:RHS repeat-associated protein
MDLDISTINMNGYMLDVVAVAPEMIVTWYVGDDIEYRQTDDNAVDIIETVTGGEHLARRVHTNSYSDEADYQFYIKNHLGSTMTMVDQYGRRSGPVYDYYPYGKQVEEEITTDAPVTPTFTGKELDLFENDFASGEDGEGWYYFGARYYDADIGNWVSVDPAGEFMNPYRYTTNPIAFVDIGGLFDAWFFNAYDKTGGLEQNVLENSIIRGMNDEKRYMMRKGWDVYKSPHRDAASSIAKAFTDLDARVIVIGGHGEAFGGGMIGGDGEYFSISDLVTLNNSGKRDGARLELLVLLSCKQGWESVLAKWQSALPGVKIINKNLTIKD